jgi:hypothetical protein
MARHWSERLVCGLCGKAFRSYAAEARHRHNIPFLCSPRTAAQRTAVADVSRPTMGDRGDTVHPTRNDGR